VAAVTLSWGGPGAFPHRYQAGKRQFEERFGVEVVEMEHTLAEPPFVSAHPELRAADLHAAFEDPDIHGIVSTIGGEDSIRVLPYLDLDIIGANPKVFLGYSDTTTIHMALRRAGLVSFYGPSIMAGFGENAGLHDYVVDGVRRILFEPAEGVAWPVNVGGWTAEFVDWADAGAQQVARSMRPSGGRRWHGGVGSEGPTVVGCLEVLDWLRGSPWWPDLTGAVLLLETSEEAPPPDALVRFLRTLALTGELAELAGLVLGRPGGPDLAVEDHVLYDQAAVQVVRREQGLADVPIVTNVDFGHTDPMWTVPEGIPLHLDPEADALVFLEPGVN
jgi:muramoyltetrapeptide carboxypeptidase LdcA involved in peptidoglycan recycling